MGVVVAQALLTDRDSWDAPDGGHLGGRVGGVEELVVEGVA